MDRKHHPDCVVLGAGIAGVCTALYLQKAGASVAIMDAGLPGSGASFGNAGIVVNTRLSPVFAGLTATSLLSMLASRSSPLNVRWSKLIGMTPWFMRMLRNANAADVERITRALADLSRPGARLYAELCEEADMGDLVQAKGSLALHRSEAERERDWNGNLTLLRSLGVPMERVGPTDIRALAGGVDPSYTHGIYSPDFQHAADPQAFVRKLFDLFTRRGGTYIPQKAEDLIVEAGRVAGLRSARERVAAGSVVVAAGAGSARFAKLAGEPVPHQAVGGYHVMLGDTGIDLRTPLLPMDFRFAITPMRNGIRLAGTYEFGGEALAPSARVVDDMLRHVVNVLPGIRVNPVSTWRGFRSYLPDGLPIIGKSAACRDLHYLFGLSSAGMINGAAAGHAVASLWNGKDPGFDVAPYSVTRF